MSETVSVLFVLPAGTAEDSAVRETLRGISSQTYPSSLMEVIQVQYAPEVPEAHTSALNAARDGATGGFVVQVEPGVVWDGNKVEQQVIQLQADLSTGACVHRMTARDGGGKTWAFDLAEVRAYGPTIACFLKSPWGPGAAMFSEAVAAQLGAYRNVEEALWEYAVRLICREHPLDLMDEDLAIWHVDAAAPLETRRSLVPTQVRYLFLKSYLDRTSPEALFAGRDLAREPGGRLVLAGLYQKNDDFDASHTLCQEVGRESDCPEASYWHGVAHRRGPDFPNARSWFGKTGDLQALPEIYREAVAFLQRVLQMPDYGEAREVALRFLRHLQDRGTWDPLYFVDLCEACVVGGSEEERRLLEEMQEVELRALFDWTYRMAAEG